MRLDLFAHQTQMIQFTAFDHHMVVEWSENNVYVYFAIMMKCDENVCDGAY